MFVLAWSYFDDDNAENDGNTNGGSDDGDYDGDKDNADGWTMEVGERRLGVA